MSWLWLVLFVIAMIFGLVVFRGAPYVPSKKADIRQSLTKLYKLTSDDVLVDIGSGDGIVLREAAKIGARAVGYEINPILVFISRWLSRKSGRVKVNLADFWFEKLPDDTTVVYIFSVSRDMKKIIRFMQKEADRLGRPMNLINYGSELKGVKVANKIGAYHLYTFKPLHQIKAQV